MHKNHSRKKEKFHDEGKTQKSSQKKQLGAITAAAMVFSVGSFMPDAAVTAEAAPKQKVVRITPIRMQKCLKRYSRRQSKHFGTDKSSRNYSYVFKITLPEASKLRITGLARYSFWAWGGKMNYKLTNSLAYETATFTETWETYVYSDHTWEQQLGNYCDKLFTLNKGTYYLFASTDLEPNWREETYSWRHCQ